MSANKFLMQKSKKLYLVTHIKFKQKRWISAIMEYIKNYNRKTTDNIPEDFSNSVLNELSSVL